MFWNLFKLHSRTARAILKTFKKSLVPINHDMHSRSCDFLYMFSQNIRQALIQDTAGNAKVEMAVIEEKEGIKLEVKSHSVTTRLLQVVMRAQQ